MASRISVSFAASVLTLCAIGCLKKTIPDRVFLLDIADAPVFPRHYSGHLFARVRMQGDELYVSLIDDSWLKQMVEAGLAPQSTIGEGRQIVLTAPTSELQKFISLHAADPAAWNDDEEGLHRVR
jgi:hypothetical protein